MIQHFWNDFNSFRCKGFCCVNDIVIGGTDTLIFRICEDLLLLLPFSVCVRCVFDTVIVEAPYQIIQYAMPYLLKPSVLSKPLYDRGADRIICADERPARQCFCQNIISEAAKCPNLRTVVGAVYARGHIAALTVVVMI